MTLTQAVLLGIVQGLTEFLPVSSSGHLLLFQRIFGLEQPQLAFLVAVHVGTLTALLWCYRRDLVRILGSLRPGPPTERMAEDRRLLLLLLVATLPTAVLGLVLEGVFEAAFASLSAVAGFWLLTAVLLWIADGLSRRRPRRGRMSYQDALWIGLFQGAAIAPGLSRSGATVAAGLLRGLAPAEAVHFSFLLAIPVILGAAVLELPALGSEPTLPLSSVLAGTAAAAVSGAVAIYGFVQMVGRGRLGLFGWYTGALGLWILLGQVWQ